uniref:Uncharacterized protein n=1 Tax=Suricata suricatta TaxID=37032 RepID=A0A673SNV0_SURSU
VPGGLEKACHRCVLKIASNTGFTFVLFAFLMLPLSMARTGIPLTVGLHQAEAACGHGRGDG